MSIIRTWLSIPKRINMEKKITDHNRGSGIWANACGKTTKTSPGPSSITLSILFPKISIKYHEYLQLISKYISIAKRSFGYLPWVNAKFPIVAKTIIPHRIQVRASTKTTIRVSRKIGPWNLLYDANEIKSPKAIPIELKTWAAAYTHTYNQENIWSVHVVRYQGLGGQ